VPTASENAPSGMRTLSIAGFLWVVALAWLSSDSGVGITGFFLFVYGGLALAIWWLVRRLRVMGARRRTPDAGSPSWRQWLVTPACLALGLAVNVLEGPNNPLFVARFRISEAALTREARRLLQTPETGKFEPRRIGLFVVERAGVVDGQVRFITATCGMIDSCGVVYSPVTAPKRWGEDSFAPLSGRWWHLYERF
jgi:hypothetical protein